jgi:hypothetical protein
MSPERTLMRMARPERLLADRDYRGRLALKGPLGDCVASAFSRVRLRAARVEQESEPILQNTPNIKKGA